MPNAALRSFPRKLTEVAGKFDSFHMRLNRELLNALGYHAFGISLHVLFCLACMVRCQNYTMPTVCEHNEHLDIRRPLSSLPLAFMLDAGSKISLHHIKLLFLLKRLTRAIDIMIDIVMRGSEK